MKTYQGILKRIDIGMGGWQLLCESGTIYDLYGDIPMQLANAKVRIQANPTEGMGFIMGGGTALEVLSIEKIS